jgi:hypothetical protein
MNLKSKSKDLTILYCTITRVSQRQKAYSHSLEEKKTFLFQFEKTKIQIIF